jgi:hypothetical protein
VSVARQAACSAPTATRLFLIIPWVLQWQYRGRSRRHVLALYRRIYNDEEDQFLGGQRKDRQQIYILNIGIPRLAFAGIVPNLYLKRTINASSIDWAYKYDQTEVALKSEKKF